MDPEEHPLTHNGGDITVAVVTRVNSTVTWSIGGRTRAAVIGGIQIGLHGPSGTAAVELVEDVEITILAFIAIDGELKVVCARFLATEEKDVVVSARDVTALGATSLSDDTVFAATGMVGPSGPPVVTNSLSALSNLATKRICLKIIVNQHLVLSA